MKRSIGFIVVAVLALALPALPAKAQTSGFGIGFDPRPTKMEYNVNAPSGTVSDSLLVVVNAAVSGADGRVYSAPVVTCRVALHGRYDGFCAYRRGVTLTEGQEVSLTLIETWQGKTSTSYFSTTVRPRRWPMVPVQPRFVVG